MTGDAADLTDDPIVNLRAAHLVELYLRHASANRADHLVAHPKSVDEALRSRAGSDGHALRDTDDDAPR